MLSSGRISGAVQSLYPEETFHRNGRYHDGDNTMKGRVIKFDPARGFGFIASRDHDGDLFFHIRDVKNADTLRAGQSVSFDLRMTKKGPAAVAVIAGRRHLSPFFFYAAIATVSVVVLAVYFGAVQVRRVRHALAGMVVIAQAVNDPGNSRGGIYTIFRF